MLIKRAFSDNFMLKVIALVLAVLTWFAINEITSHEKTFENIPLEVLVGDEWSVRALKPDSFKVTFRGSREDIAELDKETVKVQVDLGDAEEDVHTINLTPKNVLFPGATYPYKVEPPMVYIQLDQISEKIVNVKPNVTGTLSPGYRMESATAAPKVVKLVGSRRRLEGIESVQTAPIELSGRIKSFSQRVAILSPSEEWVVQADPSRVDVNVTLAGQDAARTFTNIAVQVMNPPGYEGDLPMLEPAIVSVTVEGRDTLVQATTPSDILAFVRLGKGQASGDARQPVWVKAPHGLDVLRVEPQDLKLKHSPKTLEPLEDETDSSDGS